MNHRSTIVLTGSTGTFGRFIAAEFLKRDLRLVLLVRGKNKEEARARAREIIKENLDGVEVFRSDLTTEHLGLSEEDYFDLASRTTHILHSAASTRFNLPLEEARVHNVQTTKEMVAFARQCKNLVRFGFVSTAMVAGRRSGVIKEDEFEHNVGFNNSYQQTKYEAEALVRANAKKFPIVIFRPPLVISPVLSVDHKGPINFLAVLISLVAKEHLPYVPGTEISVMDVVNSLDAARAITRLMLKQNLSHDTYHITNGADAITIKTFHHLIEEKLGKRIPIEYCGNMESFLKRIKEIPKHRPEIQMVYKKAESFLMEPAFPKIFDNQHTLSELNIMQLGEEPIDTLRLMFSDKLWSLSE